MGARFWRYLRKSWQHSPWTASLSLTTFSSAGRSSTVRKREKRRERLFGENTCRSVHVRVTYLLNNSQELFIIMDWFSFSRASIAAFRSLFKCSIVVAAPMSRDRKRTLGTFAEVDCRREGNNNTHWNGSIAFLLDSIVEGLHNLLRYCLVHVYLFLEGVTRAYSSIGYCDPSVHVSSWWQSMFLLYLDSSWFPSPRVPESWLAFEYVVIFGCHDDSRNSQIQLLEGRSNVGRLPQRKKGSGSLVSSWASLFSCTAYGFCQRLRDLAHTRRILRGRIEAFSSHCGGHCERVLVNPCCVIGHSFLLLNAFFLLSPVSFATSCALWLLHALLARDPVLLLFCCSLNVCALGLLLIDDSFTRHLHVFAYLLQWKAVMADESAQEDNDIDRLMLIDGDLHRGTLTCFVFPFFFSPSKRAIPPPFSTNLCFVTRPHWKHLCSRSVLSRRASFFQDRRIRPATPIIKFTLRRSSP